MIFVQDPSDLTMGPVARAIRRKYRLDCGLMVPNLVGIRSLFVGEGPLRTDEYDPFASQTGQWDDYIGVVWFDGNIWHEHLFAGTTDPGKVAASENERGTAVMKPGQYVDAYALGNHRGYPAIVNWGKVAPDYWRVRRVPGEPPTVVAENDEYIGLNIHRARAKDKPAPEEVGPYSAGCQVIREYRDWDYFYSLVKELFTYAQAIHGVQYMTYTLLTTHDVTDTSQPQGAQ
jgi:hypothetical protein